ncbi:MAG: SRPBCC domain-containing protein [Acidobacteriota bacterium]
MSAAGHHHALVSRVIPGTPEEVFGAWEDPGRLRDWLAGEGEVSVDFRPGGAFRIVMVMSGQRLLYGGTYRRIEPPRLLAFTWRVGEEDVESIVRVELEAAGERRTRMTIVHGDLATARLASDYELAWNGFINILEHQIEAMIGLEPPAGGSTRA